METSPITVKLEPKPEVEQTAPPEAPPATQPLQVTIGPVDQPSLAEQLRTLGKLRQEGMLSPSQHQRATEITLEANTQLNAFVSSQLQLDALP